MPEQSKASPGTQIPVAEAPKKRAPTLYGIIIFKLVKGGLFVALAITLFALSDDDLPEQFRRLLHFLRIQTDTKFWVAVAERIGQITQVNMLWTAAGVLIYSLFALVEGVGMMFRASWAGWLAIGESAFFIPLEVHHLVQRFSWGLTGLLITNIVIVWYLLQNRHRLFRHHLH